MTQVVPVRDTPRILAIVQAGGAGSRMDVLTRERAKPALPFAGSYQLIDFALSNLAHSGIPDVWVSVQYQAASLDRHLASGRPWDLDRTRGGYRRLVPEQGAAAAMEGFSTGNADNLYRISDDIAQAAPDIVIVTSADHVFALDLRAVVARHLERGAECTLVTTEVTKTEAAHKAVVISDRSGKVTAVDYKPSRAETGQIATEIFVYDAAVLLSALDTLRLELAEAGPDEEGLGDFGEHLLPRLVERGSVYVHPLPGYWKDLGRPEVYLEAHRDLLAGKVDVFDHPDWPMITRFPEFPPARVADGARVVDALLSPGVVVEGTVRRSVLGPGCHIAAGAVVEDCVLFESVRVEEGARCRTAIIDSRVTVGTGAKVGSTPRHRPTDDDITLIGADSVVPDQAVIRPGSRLEPGTTSA